MSDQDQKRKRVDYGRAVHQDTQHIREETRVIKGDVAELMSLLDPQSTSDKPDPIDEMIDLLKELSADLKQIKAHLSLDELHGTD